MIRPFLLLPVSGLCALLAAPPSLAQARSARDGIFTAAQAARGKAAYRQHCTYCHHDDLLGGEDLKVVPPALVGIAFSERWTGKTVGEFFDVLARTMPWERTTLTPPLYADLVAYLLQENGYPAGSVELPPDPDHLKAITIPALP